MKRRRKRSRLAAIERKTDARDYCGPSASVRGHAAALLTVHIFRGILRWSFSRCKKQAAAHAHVHNLQILV